MVSLCIQTTQSNIVKMMDLSAWRNAVSFGAYLQPIQLQVNPSKALQKDMSNTVALPPALPPSSRISSIEPTKESTNDVSVTSTTHEDAQNVAEHTNEKLHTITIPPYTCQELNGGDQMALNVGGPVWAMDWLPSKPAANAAAVAAALIKIKTRKPQRMSKKALAALKDKENEIDSTAIHENEESAEEESMLEWRFLALATHPPCQVKDGKVIKSTPPDHYYDAPESGRNLIQIWAVPVQRSKTCKIKKTSQEVVRPRLVYAIDHESGVAWDLQWCPLVKKFPQSHRRENILGILAVCFGDGSMRLFEIPMIPEERLQKKICCSNEALVEKTHPIVVASLPRIMQLSVRWSPHCWFMLLTGGSDGLYVLQHGKHV